MFQRTAGLLLESTGIAFLATRAPRGRRTRRSERLRSRIRLRPHVGPLEQRALLSDVPVNINPYVNSDLQTYTHGSDYPTGGTSLTVGGVAFTLANYPGGGTGVIQTPNQSSPSAFDVPVKIADPTTVYTLINSAAGIYGDTVGAIEFKATGGLDDTVNLVEGQDIRDHNNGGYNNTIGQGNLGAIYLNTASFGGGQVRLDQQGFKLPSSFQSATLTDIILLGYGNGSKGNPFLAAATVTSSPPSSPPPSPRFPRPTPPPTPSPTPPFFPTSTSGVVQLPTSTPNTDGSLTPGPAVSPRFVTRTVLAARPRSPRSGQPVTLVATVNLAGGTRDVPAGSVTFLDGSAELGTVPLVRGRARLVTSALHPGRNTIQIFYNSGPGMAPSTATIVETVRQPRSSIRVKSAAAVSDSAPPPLATSPLVGPGPNGAAGPMSAPGGRALLGTRVTDQGVTTTAPERKDGRAGVLYR
jgi:hypothetical protein